MAWLFALGFAAGFGAVSLQHPVAVCVVVSLIALMTWRENKREGERIRAAAEDRRGESICGFARSFDARAVDPLVIRVVYEQLQGELRAYQAGFPVRAADRLKEDLGVDSEDLDMSIAVEIARRAGRTFEGTDSNPFAGRVKTASDLVHFFNHQPEVVPTE